MKIENCCTRGDAQHILPDSTLPPKRPCDNQCCSYDFYGFLCLGYDWFFLLQPYPTWECCPKTSSQSLGADRQAQLYCFLTTVNQSVSNKIKYLRSKRSIYLILPKTHWIYETISSCFTFTPVHPVHNPVLRRWIDYIVLPQKNLETTTLKAASMAKAKLVASGWPLGERTHIRMSTWLTCFKGRIQNPCVDDEIAVLWRKCSKVYYCFMVERYFKQAVTVRQCQSAKLMVSDPQISRHAIGDPASSRFVSSTHLTPLTAPF